MSYPKHSTQTYRGIEIEINYDESPINPFEDWDGCVPLISTNKDYSEGQILNYLRNYLTYNQVRKNQRRIVEMMQGDKRNPFTYSFEEFREDYPISEFDRTEMLKDDVLYDWLNEGIDNMKIFCEEFKIKHLKSTSRGYSQGDWSDIFICWTPEFQEVTGRDYKSMGEKDFQDGFNLFTNWAWGDVYQYNIDDENGDNIGSCGGFYGDDFENNGLMEYAQSDIDSYMENKRQTKQSKLKTLIKNDVPLSKRNVILEAV